MAKKMILVCDSPNHNGSIVHATERLTIASLRHGRTKQDLCDAHTEQFLAAVYLGVHDKQAVPRKRVVGSSAALHAALARFAKAAGKPVETQQLIAEVIRCYPTMLSSAAYYHVMQAHRTKYLVRHERGMYTTAKKIPKEGHSA